MDGQSDKQLIAQERTQEITLSPAQLYYRDELATAAAGSEYAQIFVYAAVPRPIY